MKNEKTLDCFLFKKMANFEHISLSRVLKVEHNTLLSEDWNS